MKISRQDAPFAGLDPDCILDAIESLGLGCDGRVLALNSYENRVFRVGIEGAPPLVAKFYRPQRWSDAAIREEHAFSAELRAADLSVVAPLQLAGDTLHRHRGFRFALFPMQGGRAPEPGDRDTLIQIGQALGRMHALGAGAAFAHRTRLTVDTHAEEPVQYLLDADWLPPELEDNFATLCEQLIEAIDAAWTRAGPFAGLRLHGDCHPGNLLWRDRGRDDWGVHFVDLDDALTGPAMQDLWMLLSGDRQARAQQLRWLLEGYEIFRAFDPRELHLIEALRAIRLLHYHAWIARRWHDPAFPTAFPWFDSPRHWEEVIAQIQEQLAAMREPVLVLD
jgi:Ser/Thr protein kinase RdoA (MazF antagonist)